MNPNKTSALADLPDGAHLLASYKTSSPSQAANQAPVTTIAETAQKNRPRRGSPALTSCTCNYTVPQSASMSVFCHTRTYCIHIRLQHGNAASHAARMLQMVMVISTQW